MNDTPMAPPEQPLNLYQRINAVRKAVSYVQKDKSVSTGTSGSYKAVTHDAVVAVLRDAMNEHGVIAFPSLTNSRLNEPTVDADGKRAKQFRYEASFEVVFLNADNPEEREMVIVEGHAMDNADKAPGKAISYAFKYALLKMFMLETGEDEESRYSEAMDDAELGKHLEAMSKATTAGDLSAATAAALSAAQAAGDRQAERTIIRAKASREAILPVPISSEDFEKGMKTWRVAVSSGKKTPDEIILALGTKRWAPSKEQETAIRALAKQETEQ